MVNICIIIKLPVTFSILIIKVSQNPIKRGNKIGNKTESRFVTFCICGYFLDF